MTETKVDVKPAPPPTAASLVADERDKPTFVIRPAPRWPHLDLPELWHYRELLLTFVWRDLAVRYKQSFLGVAWALIVPVFTATVYVLIFGKFAKFPSGNLAYPILVYSGLLPMQYFTSALTGASISIVSNGNLVSKVYFPRVLLPLAGILVPVIDFVLALVVLIALMAWYGTWPAGPEAALAPFFLLLAVAASLGAGLFLAALNVRYRDVRYAVPVFLQVLPFVSGVPFATSSIPEKWQWILSLNPMTSVIGGWRWSLLGAPAPNAGQVAVGVVISGLMFLGGLAYFRSSEPRFADTI